MSLMSLQGIGFHLGKHVLNSMLPALVFARRQTSRNERVQGKYVEHCQDAPSQAACGRWRARQRAPPR